MTQEEHDKYQSEYGECCMLLGNANPKQMSAMLEIIKALRQPDVSGQLATFLQDRLGKKYSIYFEQQDIDELIDVANCH